MYLPNSRMQNSFSSCIALCPSLQKKEVKCDYSSSLVLAPLQNDFVTLWCLGKLISGLRYSNTHAQRGYPAGPWTNPVTRVWDMSGGREDLPETANIPVRVGCPCARCGGHIPIIPKSHTNSIRSQDFLFAIFLKTYSKWIKPFQPRPLLSSIRRIRVRFSPFSFCPCLFFFLWNFYAVELCIVWDLLSSPGRRRRPPLQKGRDTK